MCLIAKINNQIAQNLKWSDHLKKKKPPSEMNL